MPSGVGSLAVAATVRPSREASAAVGRPIATNRHLPKGGNDVAMRRAALGEAATTASTVPASRAARASFRG